MVRATRIDTVNMYIRREEWLGNTHLSLNDLDLENGRIKISFHCINRRIYWANDFILHLLRPCYLCR